MMDDTRTESLGGLSISAAFRLKSVCAFCESEVAAESVEKSEEKKELENIACYHFRKRILKAEDFFFSETPSIADDVDRCCQLLNTVVLCERCVIQFCTNEGLILASQVKYWEKMTGPKDFSEMLADPWLDLKRFAHAKLKTEHVAIAEKLRLIQKYTPIHGMPVPVDFVTPRRISRDSASASTATNTKPMDITSATTDQLPATCQFAVSSGESAENSDSSDGTVDMRTTNADSSNKGSLNALGNLQKETKTKSSQSSEGGKKVPITISLGIPPGLSPVVALKHVDALVRQSTEKDKIVSNELPPNPSAKITDVVRKLSMGGASSSEDDSDDEEGSDDAKKIQLNEVSSGSKAQANEKKDNETGSMSTPTAKFLLPKTKKRLADCTDTESVRDNESGESSDSDGGSSIASAPPFARGKRVSNNPRVTSKNVPMPRSKRAKLDLSAAATSPVPQAPKTSTPIVIAKKSAPPPPPASPAKKSPARSAPRKPASPKDNPKNKAKNSKKSKLAEEPEKSQGNDGTSKTGGEKTNTEAKGKSSPLKSTTVKVGGRVFRELGESSSSSGSDSDSSD